MKLQIILYQNIYSNRQCTGSTMCKYNSNYVPKLCIELVHMSCYLLTKQTLYYFLRTVDLSLHGRFL